MIVPQYNEEDTEEIIVKSVCFKHISGQERTGEEDMKAGDRRSGRGEEERTEVRRGGENRKAGKRGGEDGDSVAVYRC